MTIRILLALVLLSTQARADVGPPPRNDCHLLAPGSPCWVDGKRPGACVEKTDGGAVVCAAGVAPTRAIASAKPAASASTNGTPPTWCSFGHAGKVPTRAPFVVVFLGILLGLRRSRAPSARS